MAYIVNTTETDTVTATTVTVSLGTHVTNDLLLVFLSQDVGGTAFTTASTGWNILVEARSGTSVRHGVAYKVATSGAEASPVFSGANDGWLATCVVVRDADATNPFGATPTSGTDYLATAYTSSVRNTAGAITTAANDCLLFYSYGKDGDGSAITVRSDVNYTRSISRRSDANASTVVQSVAYAQQGSSGATTEFTHSLTTSASSVVEGIVCAVRNKSGGSRQPDIRGPIDEFRWYGGLGTNRTGEGSTTWSELSGFAATVGGITCSSTAPTVSGNGSLASTENTASSWVGGYSTFTAKDMTGDIANLTFSRTTTTSDTFAGNEGVVVAFGDGTNWAAYQLQNKKNGWLFNVGYSRSVALGNATLYDSSGTVDWANVTTLAVLVHRTGSITTSASINVSNLILYSSPVSIVGGGGNRPTTFADAATAINSWVTTDFANLQGGGQALFKQSVQIGDGTNVTYFDAVASSLEFPLAYGQVGGSYMGLNAGAGALTLNVKATASDTISLASGVCASDVLHNLTIDSASSTSATYSFAQAFVGFSPTWKTGINPSGSTFKECGEIDAKGSDWTDCTIAKTVSTDAAIAFSEDGGSMTRCTIDVTGTSAAYHLELGAAVTAITLADVTFTGTPATDKIHVLKTTGTVTITTSGTTSIVAGDVTTEGATVVISGPTLNQSVTVSGFTAGSRIQIYDTTSSTELFNGTASSGDTVVSGSTATWTDPTAAAADRAIRIRVSYVSGVTAKNFIETSGLTCGTLTGSESITYPVTPSADTTYDSNAINGPSIYATSGITFTDAATDLVNCNIGGGSVTYPTIYACFVYWNFTATGIANDFTYVDAPDTANYLFSSMKIRNTSATDLMVTGGYGRDATSGLSSDIIDTAGSTGNIFLAPDHVVAYATGSGSLTAGDISNIWSNATRTITTTIPSAAQNAAEVLSAATTTPIAAEIKKVAGVTVTGAGTEADPWGP